MAPLLHFFDWLLERVVLVEIGTTDQDMALEIFETMNDRGLRLSNTDMLKSFLIARMEDPAAIATANKLWRARVEELIAWTATPTAEFIKAWLRGKYADTIRERKKDAVPRDFDLIGTAFHKWVRDNRTRLGLDTPGGLRRPSSTPTSTGCPSATCKLLAAVQRGTPPGWSASSTTRTTGSRCSTCRSWPQSRRTTTTRRSGRRPR